MISRPEIRKDQLVSDNKISEVTRRNIFDGLRVGRIPWNGSLGEPDFLNRMFDLSTMPSFDHRFKDAEGDIWQHRVRNHDWEEDWIFSDGRFNLLRCPDEVFLRFLCEMLHPVLRPDASEVDQLMVLFNENLAVDGWQIVEQTRLSGRPVFSARRLLDGGGTAVAAARAVAFSLEADYITQQVTRMESAIATAPDLAIGTSKEFLETVCKTILKEKGVACTGKEDIPELVRMTLKQLRLAPDDVPDDVKGARTIRILLMNLASVAQGITELRGLFGTGHGKEAGFTGLSARHARLVVNAASTLGVFLFETHTQSVDDR
jgi:hypothetical protein